MRNTNVVDTPLEPVGNEERLAVSLKSQSLGRAIGYCVTELNTDKSNFSGPSGGWLSVADERNARGPLKPVDIFLPPYPKYKKGGKPTQKGSGLHPLTRMTVTTARSREAARILRGRRPIDP